MIKQIVFSLLFLITFFSATAQPGANDPSFNSTDLGFGKGDGANDIVSTTSIQSDGKIIIGGNFTRYNGTSINYIARLNSDGNLDADFTPGTGANGTVATIVVQSDGKIYIGGNFTSYNGTSINRIARLNSDGSLDAGFNPGTGANGTVSKIAVQSDGKIIIVGSFTNCNGTSINYIARLNSDGSLDAGFNPGTAANNYVRTTTLQSDGKIIIGGFFTSYNGTSINNIARLNSDGSLDASFNPGTGVTNAVYTTSVQSDGKIIIGGAFTLYNGTARNRIARLNSNGSLDGSFTPGTAANNTVYTTSVQSDGKILIGGDFTSYNGTSRNRIARLNSDGSLDGSFTPGTAANNTVYTTSVQSDGKIIIGGWFTSYNSTTTNSIARLNSDGSLDAGFNPGTGSNSTTVTIAVQNDGKIIIGGAFTRYNGTTINRIARLNSDGSLDASFTPGTGANNTVSTIAIQSDGKIIIGGSFTSYNGTLRNRIARLNSDGSLDASFTPGTGANNAVYTTSVQSDGKIIIGGAFASYNGTSRNYIARLNSDGSLDAGFTPGTGASIAVLTTAVQSDGKIYIGGNFTSYNGSSINRIARLNSDGSIDASFTPGTGANGIVNTITVQSNGKIIIGGQFTSYNGTSLNRIARLNSDGTLDTGFTPGTGANGTVYTTSVQSDGKIIIGGAFTLYNGTSRNRIVRLNSDGSMDAGFNPGAGADNYINTTAIQSDGKIIIGGDFTSYNGIGRNRLARIIIAPSTNANLSSLTISAGTLTPTFDAATTSNTASVSNATTSVTVTPTVADATASIQVQVNSGGYSAVSSGSASSALSLNVGSNSINVKVTAQDGTTIKTYTITVTRDAASLSNTWVGTTGNWSNSSNWSSGSVPDGSADISISSGTVTMDTDITIASGKILTLSGTAALIIAPQKTLTVSGIADFGVRSVVLQSDATGTAAIGTVSGTLTNANNVTAERYIPKTEGSTTSSRRWRLLTTPIENTTINAAWQNSGSWNGTDVLNETTGTIITGASQGTAAVANANGFDFWSAISNGSASIRSYTQGATQGSWTALTNTTTTNAFNNQQAYLLFIRGSRNSLYASGTESSSTTLRATGTLKQGTKTVTVSGSNGYTLLGNPYAAPLDFDHLYTGNSTVIKQQFWVWDAATGDYGGYKLIKNVGGVYLDIPTPFTGTTGSSTNLSIIQSGQGFFVEPASAAGGTLTIRENDKAANSSAPVNVLLRAGSMEKMRINLYQQNNNTTALADGVMAVYENSYNTSVKDNDDVRKPNNFNENMAIVRNGTYMMMEARPLINDKDTLFLEMWNLIQQPYQLQLKAEKMEASGLRAYLEDTYLQTKTPISLQGDVVPVNFMVTSDAASAALTRFRLLFTLDVTPVSGVNQAQTNIKLYPNPMQGITASIHLQQMKVGRYTIRIENSLGQLQLQQQFSHVGGASNLQLQLPMHITAGLYFVKYIRDGVLIKTEKFIIE